MHTHKIYTIGSTEYPNNTNTQDKYNRDLELRRREERSLINTLFLDKYECFSLLLDREERCDEEDKIRSLEIRSRDNLNGNGNVVAARAEGIQIQAEEFDLIAAATDLNEIKEVNANCILMANLLQASILGTQTDKALVYDSDGYAKLHHYDNCYNNDIFNMFTQEKQYTELLDPIPELHQVPQNDSNAISEVSSMEQGQRTVKQHPETIKETRAYHESLFHNLAAGVENVNKINHKMKETNTELTNELARYENQEKFFEISQEIYDKLKKCYQKSVYQEQCLTKMINPLHISFGKQITTLNKEISNLNNRLSKEKSTVSSLQEEKKKLKFDFKIREYELLDKQIKLENKIKELDNILVKIDQSIQTMHMLSPKQESFYHTEQKMALESADVSKSISIPNEEFSDDTTPSVARKFLNEIKSTIVTLQRVVKQKMTLDIHNWSSSVHQEIHKIIKYEIFPIVNQVDARVQNFEIQFLKEAAKFVLDFKSLAKEADESLAKNKALELEIERVNITAKTRRPHPRSNTKNDRVRSTSKSSCIKNKEVELEEHPRNLLLSKNKKHMSSECNKVKLAIHNDKSKVVYAMSAPRTTTAAQAPQVLQTPTTTTTTTGITPSPTNSSSQATSIPSTLQNVDELKTQQQHVQHQPATIVDNVSRSMFNENTFVNPFATQSTSAAESSSSQYVDPSNIHVYKLMKELYGLKQAPKAWYDELSSFLLQDHFFKGTIDLMLFIRCFDDDILVVKVYVYDIIFGFTNPRPDIVHDTCLCARYQAKPTEKHLKEVKRIFRFLWGTVSMGLWYTKDSGFEITGFSDADYARCKDTFKSTSSGLNSQAKSWLAGPQKNKTVKSMAFPSYSSLAAVKATYSFSKIKDKSNNIKQNMKTVLNFKDTFPLRSVPVKKYPRLSQGIKIKISSLIIKISSQRSRSKITSMQKYPQKRFSRIQGTKTQDITKSDPQFNDHPLGDIYLAHTDYSLWEVILNGNSAVQITKNEAGNEIEVPPITAPQILARTRERKAKSTLLMAILDEHLARFHRIKDAKTLWAAIKLNDAYNVSTATCHSSQAQDQIDQDDLEEIDLKWKVAMLSNRVKQFYKKTRRKLEFNRKEPVGFDKTKVECFKCHRRWHFARDCRSSRNSGNRSRDVGNAGYRSYQGEEEATEFVLMAFTLNPSSYSSSNSKCFRLEPILAKIDFVKSGESIKHVKLIESVKHVKLVKTAEHAEKSKNFSSSPKVGKGTGQRESRPVWNNVQRINHQNKFSPTVVFTRSGRIPVSAAKPKAAASTSTAKPVNTARPKQSVNFSKSRFTAVKGNRVTVVKTSAGYVWRPRGHPQQALKNKGIVDSGCSRHMIGNIQFWNTATFKIVNLVKQIHAIVDGKAVVISESLVRSDLLFNDEDDLRADEAVQKEGVTVWKGKLVQVTDPSAKKPYSGAKKEWGLSPKAKVRVLHTAQLDVTEATIFKKDYATVSNNFIAIYGTWIYNSSKCLRDKIRVAVWNYGENKSPSPDGYMFEFFRRYWRFISSDFCLAVACFFESGSFPKGSNSSFIALIPKVMDAKFVTDFRTIILIGCVYKVVTKILANHLATVISDLVSDIQSAFVANRQILDGPFILNELLACCKRKNKQAMIFKVDFAKAYDSVRWDYLLDVLQAFGFGPNWCKWIRGTFSFAMASILVNGSPTSEFSFFCGLKQGDPLAPYLFILIKESLHISFSRATSDGLFKGIQIQGLMAIPHLFYADDAVFIGEWSDSNLDNIVEILKCLFLVSRLKIKIQKSQVLGVGIPRNIVNQVASLIGCAVVQNAFRYQGVMVRDSMSRKLAWADTIQKLHSWLSKWKVKTLSIREMEAIRCNFFNGVDPAERKITWVSWDKVLASKKNGGLGVSSFHALNRALLLKWVWRFLSQDGSLWFPRLFSLETDKESIVASKLGSSSMDLLSEWRWCVYVKEVHTILDDIFLSSAADATRMVKYIPIKINVFAWRARLDRLLTISNLVCRGVVLDSSLCPLCGLVPEDIHHVLLWCDTAKLVFRRICHWWDLDWHDLLSFSDWNAWFSAIRLPSRIKLILEGVFYVARWHL
uniref:RNA-directed DNA polymerase, eukaryota n=1 Tax=Tanacetum cinerariifolium TaxID=118510 RepID=A0A6L2JR77_TANCI|nr:RNA-directed DNA polymerase, eukaryota [Tanacetum cinerariifolium]